MLGPVVATTLRGQRRALLWWALGIAGAVVLTTGFYPSVRENAAALTDVLESLPEGLRRALLGASGDFFSAAGYLQARLFSIIAPLLLLIYAIGAGARAIAGEEERKTLDLLLATPLSRRRLFLDKTAAMLTVTAGLSVVVLIALVVTGPPFELSVAFDRLAAAVLDAFLLASAFGGIALAVGAGTGRHGLAVGVASGLAVASYLVDVLALSVDGLEWLQRVTLFYYYRAPQPLTRGLDPADALVLAAVVAVSLAVGLFAFERRDLAA